jgi:hypothetical protein
MEALRFIEKAHNGQLTIHLPEELNEAEVEVIVRPLHETKDDVTQPSRLEVAQEYVQKLKQCDFNREDYNVYEQ